MAIAFDSAGSASDANANGTIQSTHTVVSNTNGILLAFFACDSATSSLNSSPKYNGQALTKIIAGTDTSNFQFAELWYLKAPPTGLGTLKGTWSSSLVQSKTVITSAYTGVDQTTPIPGSSLFIGTSVSSGSLTQSISANNWLVGGMQNNGTIGTVTSGNTRGTILLNEYNAFVDNTNGTIRWTFANLDDTVMVGAEIAQVSGGGGGANVVIGYKSQLGIGY